MRGPLLALLAALAVGSATGAVAFTSARDAVTPEPPAATPAGAAVVPATSDPCAEPASADPACVVVVPVPAAVQMSDDDGADPGAGDVAPAPRRPGVKLRGDGSVDDCCGGIDDDRSGRRAGDDDRESDRDRDRDDHDRDDRDHDEDDDHDDDADDD